MDTAKIYHDSDGNERSIMQMIRYEPYWAANRVQEGEKAITERNRLRDENKRLKGCIPAYRPCPCDCIEERDGQYLVECECGNSGDLMDAQAWATEMSIIARFEKVLKQDEDR